MKPRFLSAARRVAAIGLGVAAGAVAQTVAPPVVEPKRPSPEAPGDVHELSLFVVQEATDRGYFASQTMAGGRLRQEVKDTGVSIQVVTKQFMEDLAVTNVEELFQYTTSTEVGGILGNFLGVTEGSAGETSTGDARRNPDGTSRIRGLAAPERTRNFFKSDIPFDAYNTERVDINRGANSFLFGLGSPAGLANTAMARARFRDQNEISTRVGSGGNTPAYRGSFKVNRVLLEDRLAVHVAGLMDRTTYRQEPTYENDDRQFGALAYKPFKHGRTVINAFVENGRIRGNAPDVLLPQENLSTFLTDPGVARLSINAYGNLQRFNHVEGPTQAQWNALSAADKLRYRVRNTPTANTLDAADWGNGSYGLVYDGTNGRMPAFAYTDKYRAADYQPRDPFFGPGRAGAGAPYSPYHANRSQINGTGWLDQGFTDLKTFDFSKANLGWDNDYFTRDFNHANVALEHLFLRGRAGIELAYDFQDLFRRDYVALNGANSRVMFDVNETLWLPADPNYLVSGNAAPQRNPNYGRPFILTKANSRTIDSQREAARFTGFVKYDFAERAGPRWWRHLGRHTVTLLADKSAYGEKLINYTLNSYGDPEPALHIGPANARQTGNEARDVPMYVYLGPPQLQAFTDPNFTLRDFLLAPADYQLRLPADYSIRKLSWNLGPEATNATVGLDSRVNGNERFVWGTFLPRLAPTKNYRLEETKVQSLAFNSQSFFWRDLLVVNLGYRRDRTRTWLNTEAPLVGLDETPDLSPERFRVENGSRVEANSHLFGFGGVLHWPAHLVRLPRGTNVTVHYNETENFIPATERVDQYRRPVPAPKGLNRDYGIGLYLWDNKLVARLNWFRSTLQGASSNVSGLFNSTTRSIFNHYGNLTANLRQVDADDDGRIDEAVRNAIEVDPRTGLTEDGLTRDQAVAALYPNFARAREARAAIAPFLTDELKIAYNYRQDPDGSSQTQNAGTITDTNDIESRGFEAEITFNPTRNWRFTMNVAQQQTILTRIAPALTAQLNTIWLPHLARFGTLDWNLPVEPVNGNTTAQHVNDNLLEYYVVKGQEGRPQAEQREWRVNAVGRYQFSEGRLRGASVGGAVRWQSRCATGYPILDDPRGILLPDIAHPYWSEPELSLDAVLGYRRKILGGRDWSVQLNLRNLQNWTSDRVSVVRHQPDGTPARVRYDPPLQVLLTNTFTF